VGVDIFHATSLALGIWATAVNIWPPVSSNWHAAAVIHCNCPEPLASSTFSFGHLLLPSARRQNLLELPLIVQTAKGPVFFQRESRTVVRSQTRSPLRLTLWALCADSNGHIHPLPDPRSFVPGINSDFRTQRFRYSPKSFLLPVLIWARRCSATPETDRAAGTWFMITRFFGQVNHQEDLRAFQSSGFGSRVCRSGRESEQTIDACRLFLHPPSQAGPCSLFSSQPVHRSPLTVSSVRFQRNFRPEHIRFPACLRSPEGAI